MSCTFVFSPGNLILLKNWVLLLFSIKGMSWLFFVIGSIWYLSLDPTYLVGLLIYLWVHIMA